MSDSKEIGYATSINNYLVLINGLPSAGINELVFTEDGARGLVIALHDELVEVMMLDTADIKPKQVFYRTEQPFSLKVGTFLLGRTVNALGIPVDGKGTFPKSAPSSLAIDQPIPPIKARERIRTPFETGVTTVDMLIPLAKGQRELILGNARSGKTSFLIDTIVNQKGKDVICVYGMVGRSIKNIKGLCDILSINKALDYCVIVSAPSSDMAPLIFLAPAVALSIAEYFQKQGKDVLLILDDLGVHAKFYREIALLSYRIPGRESYPGDIFYQHAHLLERAGKFNEASGGGSTTALVVSEINLDDYTGYIPTNLMAMTDGHLMFDSKLANQGIRPAIDIFLSVSRVGRQTQTLAQKLLADRVRSVLISADKLEALSRFGPEVSAQTQSILKQSAQIRSILNQPNLAYFPTTLQMIMLGLTFTPFLDTKEASFFTTHRAKILSYLYSLDLKKYGLEIAKYRTDLEFIKSLNRLIPVLEKVCLTPNS